MRKKSFNRNKALSGNVSNYEVCIDAILRYGGGRQNINENKQGKEIKPHL
jgi:hypothetical protein